MGKMGAIIPATKGSVKINTYFNAKENYEEIIAQCMGCSAITLFLAKKNGEICKNIFSSCRCKNNKQD